MSELKEYIEDVLLQIEKGKGNHDVWGSVYFDIATVKEKKGGGKIGVSVLGLAGGIKNESVSRIQFKIKMQGAHGGPDAFK
ncbi:MAG: hypothetical protein M1429_04060 [Patescibacteria group bacterium]|nr:hypothetical protein [Patescibacteria group bacterium]